jgi:gamma-glutamylcyclotransferase (GGCT)/AIG2-like uncharacterized protein YtfP
MMQNKYSVVGYGTFITRETWKNKSNVKVCKVTGFRRVLPQGNWFPYILPDEDSSFWALKFDVNEEELKQLDYYEGVPAGLYKRITITIQLKNGTEKEAFIYVPTEKTIQQQNLSLNMDKDDKWKYEIKKHSKIVEKFPELLK